VLIRGILFGLTGMGFVICGRKQKAIVPLCVDIAPCVFPYCSANGYVLVVVGGLLTAIPYFVRV